MNQEEVMTGGDAPLTAEDASQMLAALEEGDTGVLDGRTQEGSEAPDAAADDAESAGEDANAPAEGEAEGDTDAAPQGEDTGGAAEGDGSNAVVLARDGKHTIPYEKLVEARQGWQQASAQVQALQQQLAALSQATQEQPQGEPAEQAEGEDAGDGNEIFGDFSEEALAKGIHKIVNERVAAALADVEKRRQELEAERAYQEALQRNREAVLARYPHAIETIHSNEFAAWKGKFPKAIQTAITNVFEERVGGTVEEMLEVLDAYTKDTSGGAKPSPSPDLSAAKTAAKSAIAQAQAAPPSSLSSIPGGRVDGRDALARLDEMSPEEMLVAFEDMTPEQAERALARAI